MECRAGSAVGTECRADSAVDTDRPAEGEAIGERRPVLIGELALGLRERAYVQQALASNRLTYGSFTRAFEERIAALHDVRYACFCNSGTSALEVALAALKEQHGWRDGEEVIVPAVTFVATVNVVLQNRLRPVLVDVRADEFNIDPAQIERAITPRTRCIMPVHLLGLPADMDPIVEIARRHGLAIVEDSCETMFACYRGRPVGSFGEIACFSTYAAKLIVTGVGGFAVTRDAELAVLIRSLLNHGRDDVYLSVDDREKGTRQERQAAIGRRFRFERIGYSYRATELEAALGLAQLEEFEQVVAARQANAAFYTAALADLEEHLQLPTIPFGREHVFMVYPLVVKAASMRPLVYFLEEHGVETRDLLPLIHQPVYRGLFGAEVGRRCPVADQLWERGFYIGCHQHLSREDRAHVVETIHRFFAQ